MKTIIFVHGMFQNPKSWLNWIEFFSKKGYNCIAPAWPLHEGEPADLRQNPPAGLGKLALDEVVTSIERLVLDMDEKPVMIGHSVGGLVVQLLANRGYLDMGVAIDSVAPNAMLDFDWGFFKNSAIITNPLKGDDPIFMDAETFHGAFANTLSEEQARMAFEMFATHDSRNVLRDCMGSAGRIDLDLAHPPLLLIAGEKDQIIPASLTEKNYKAYSDAGSVTAYKMFPDRSHFICGEPGWEAVAAYVYDWLQANDTPAEPVTRMV
ncbi:alpha/beta hydrolase [Pontibacter sp. SGAir0037]|uniref:alpha/beta hydrolase n=1 Tax=Pontibacter sp. SGAir0037 TaxID=2571030 RepID=UPI0010CD49E2|nr:alpha/beta fold hydrolase [Pontibacter sp. SGAir0037]QCR22546.1 alpha/beta hydrolase [Pontibacter sp. SGAir0037]